MSYDREGPTEHCDYDKACESSKPKISHMTTLIALLGLISIKGLSYSEHQSPKRGGLFNTLGNKKFFNS